MTQWDADGKKDLVIGTTTGEVVLYRNIGTDADPHFDGGSFLQVGLPGQKVDINVGYDAAPIFVHWNDDGRRDLVVGAVDGLIRIYLNEGTDTQPDFHYETVAIEDGDTLIVPEGGISSPAVLDLDNDGIKDLLSGNLEGQVVFYHNYGTNDAPFFSGYELVESDFEPIDLWMAAKSRLCACDWTGDDYLDLLIGTCFGNVHLFQGRDPEGVAELPVAAGTLLPAWPNPFNPHVTLPFTLAAGSEIELSIVDTAGRRVALLAAGFYGEGRHELKWSGRNDAGARLPSGLYMARLVAGEHVAAQKLVLLR